MTSKLEDQIADIRLKPVDEKLSVATMARIAALEEKLARLSADFEETWEGLQDLNLVRMRDGLRSQDVRITCLEQMLVETDSDEFEQFYKKYPHKKAPRDAAKAFKAARKRASFEEIMAGLTQYIKHKPSDQKYAYPASWLNADRWLDTYEGASEAPGEPEAVDPEKQIRDRLRDVMGDWKKAAGLYNYFLKWPLRNGLFTLAFDGEPNEREIVEKACEKLGYGPIEWPRSQ